MSIKSEIEHKWLEETLVATTRLNLKRREELEPLLDELARHIPEEYIAGPAFCIFYFVSSVTEGYDAEIGFPVTRAVETDMVTTRTLPEMEVLSLRDSSENLQETYGKLYGYAAEHGIISDEFCREVYSNANDEGKREVELQFVVHNWNELLAQNSERVLGEEAKRQIVQGSEELTVDSSVAERFQWVKGVMEQLQRLADENEQYDILSMCAHVFPASQIEKLRRVYEGAHKRTGDMLKAVDAVIVFMGNDSGWGERPRREGRVIYSAKRPRDPEGYEKARNESERRKAYCFCPLVREHLDEGMPRAFCYCGAGWFRRQWEGAIGKPVTVEIVKSILAGDDLCEFAVHLPDGE